MSILVIDGFRNYFAVSIELNILEMIINHSYCSINEERITINSIESLWSRFESIYTSKYGILMERINTRIKEFDFKKIIIRRRNNNNFKKFF